MVDRRVERSELELERLGLEPANVRSQVIERDSSACRACGQYVEQPALHHIQFRSQGGLDIPSNLICMGWVPWHDCHLKLAHGKDARKWREIFLAIAETPSITALQWKRWHGW